MDGLLLTTSSWTSGEEPRKRVKEFDSARSADEAYDKAVDTRIHAGFVLVREAAGAAPGEIVLELLVPNHPLADVFDLDPGGRTLAVGTTLADGAHSGGEIHLVDVATGQARLVHSVPAVQGSQDLRVVLFDAAGDGLVYTVDGLDGQTRRLDLRTGETRPIASFKQSGIRPAWDASRDRLLIVDADDRVLVLDRDGEPVFDVSVASRPTDCTSAAISPSGRLLALHHFHHNIVDPDAVGDVTSQVEIWEVDGSEMVQRIWFERDLGTIGFDPTETLLLTGDRGPGAISLDTGEEVWSFPDPYRRGFWESCNAWAWSPDGSLLAVGRYGSTDLYESATRSPVALQTRPVDFQRVYRVVFSDDGHLLASGGDQGRLIVRRVQPG